MSFDPSRISEVVNAFWEDYGHALIAGAGVLVVALMVTAVVTVVRSKQRDRLVAGLTALVVLAWTSEGLWEVARYKLGLPLAFSIMTFFVYEAMMISCALQAERHRRRHASPGPAGRYVWVLASITATVVALNADSLVEALLRFTLPLAAAGLWWVGITAEREDDPDEVKQLREAERACKEATWAISWRRVLVAVGIMRPGAQKLTDAERERRIRQMVTAADTLAAAKPGSWRAGRAQQRLRRLARLASANDIATVRARVARATRIIELVMPPADPPAADHLPPVEHQGSGPGPAQAGAVPHGTDLDPLDGTAPFHPSSPNGVSRNGAGHVEHGVDVGVPRDGSREAAEQVYRASVEKGEPLTVREVAKLAGCGSTTAWRAIKAVNGTRATASPNGASPSRGAADTDALVDARQLAT